MSIQQKAQDTLVLLKESRKAQVIALCLLCAVLFLYFGEPKKVRRAAPRAPQVSASANLANQELLDDLTTSLTQQTQQNRETLESLRKEMEVQNSEMEEREQRVAEILNTMIEKMDQPTVVQGQAPFGAEPVALNQAPIFPDQEPAELEAFGSVANDSQVAPPPEPEDTRTAYIGKGDFVRVKLLAGVNAPTDGTPYPVLFKLVSDVQGPDGTNLPLGEAHLLAAAQGSLTDSRVLYRLTSMSVRLPDGERRDLEVDGFIVGEDGIRGMQGIAIDPLGKILGATAITGLVDGIGQGIASSQTNAFISDGNVFESVNGDVASFGVGRGLSNASQTWTKIIQQRVQQMVPAIQVFSGREATALFSQPVKIPGLFEQLNYEESDIFGSLD